MKKTIIILTILALLVQTAFAVDNTGYALEGTSVYLPMVIGTSSTNPPPPTKEWTAADKSTIKSIVNGSGILQKLGENADIKTVETTSQLINGESYWVDEERHSVVKNTSDLLYLGLNDDIIWPGALIKGDQAHDFVYEPITLPRAPLTISVNLEHVLCPGQNDRNLSYVVNDPNLANIRNGIASLLSQARGTCTTVPAQAFFSMQQVYNEKHLNLSIGTDISYGAGDLSSKFDWSSTTKGTKIIAKYQQIFYTVDINTPTTQADFFDPTRTSVSNVAAAMPPGTIPMYVAGIKYGMQALMFFESSYSSESMKFAVDAAYNAGLTAVDVTTNLTAEQILQNSNIAVVVYGGSTAGLDEMIYNQLDGFLTFISKSKDADTLSPGVPLVYKFRNFSDNTLALITMTSDYSFTASRFPLRPKFRIIFNRLFANWVNDGPGDPYPWSCPNCVDMDRFFLYATAKNHLEEGDTGVPISSPEKYPVYQYYNSSVEGVQIDNGTTWPSSAEQGIHYWDVRFDNTLSAQYPAGYDFDLASLNVSAYARDYDVNTSSEEGTGDRTLHNGQDILNASAEEEISFIIGCSDFEFVIYVRIVFLNP